MMTNYCKVNIEVTLKLKFNLSPNAKHQETHKKSLQEGGYSSLVTCG